MNETFDKCPKCPVCEHIGFRIYIGEDGDEMYICNGCGVCLWAEELTAKEVKG